MKVIRNIRIVILFLVIITGWSLSAQTATKTTETIVIANPNDHKAIKQSLRLFHLREIKMLKQKIEENEANFSRMINTDNPDMSEVYQNIEESQLLHSQLKKARIQLIRLIAFS